jgi:hypothetical protein
MVTTAVSGGCLTSLTKETTMNYKIVAGFLMGVVCMTVHDWPSEVGRELQVLCSPRPRNAGYNSRLGILKEETWKLIKGQRRLSRKLTRSSMLEVSFLSISNCELLRKF